MEKLSTTLEKLVSPGNNSAPPGKYLVLRQKFGCRWRSGPERVREGLVGAGMVGAGSSAGHERLTMSLRNVTSLGSNLASVTDFPKPVPECNLRFRGQNLRPSSLGSSPALLGLVRRASTNKGCFQVCDSRRCPLQACSRKTCHHSCNTDSVQKSKGFFNDL